MRQIAVKWHGQTKVAVDFLVNILKRGRDAYACRHRKRQPHRLSRIVVWILTQDDHFYLIKGGLVKRIEDQRPGRKDNLAIIFLVEEKISDGIKIRLLK